MLYLIYERICETSCWNFVSAAVEVVLTGECELSRVYCQVCPLLCVLSYLDLQNGTPPPKTKSFFFQEKCRYRVFPKKAVFFLVVTRQKRKRHLIVVFSCLGSQTCKNRDHLSRSLHDPRTEISGFASGPELTFEQRGS